MKYSEYFEIDKNYYPEINPDSVKNPGNEWQYTYPHETFVELLSSVELMLSRENSELKKGIWIEGSYGTGKSRVVWALKNLLECSEKEFHDYFKKNHDEFKKVPDLEDKLFTQRSGKLLLYSDTTAVKLLQLRSLLLPYLTAFPLHLIRQALNTMAIKHCVARLPSGFQTRPTKHISMLLFPCPSIALWAA